MQKQIDISLEQIDLIKTLTKWECPGWPPHFCDFCAFFIDCKGCNEIFEGIKNKYGTYYPPGINVVAPEFKEWLNELIMGYQQERDHNRLENMADCRCAPTSTNEPSTNSRQLTI